MHIKDNRGVLFQIISIKNILDGRKDNIVWKITAINDLERTDKFKKT
jgi:hypothetical protein